MALHHFTQVKGLLHLAAGQLSAAREVIESLPAVMKRSVTRARLSKSAWSPWQESLHTPVIGNSCVRSTLKRSTPVRAAGRRFVVKV